jgi:hypothetical protein
MRLGRSLGPARGGRFVNRGGRFVNLLVTIYGCAAATLRADRGTRAWSA